MENKGSLGQFQAQKNGSVSKEGFVKRRVLQLKAFLIKSPLIAAAIFVSVAWIFFAIVVYWAEAGVEGHNIDSFGDSLWWGIVTILTVGYGDRFPITPMGRFLAAFLMLSGVLGIAVVTARVTSFFFERAMRERRGVVDPAELNNHIMICGWKNEMGNLLNHILDSNPELTSEDLVMVNKAPEQDIANLMSIPRFKDMAVVNGEFWLEVNLKRAAPERAKKILILADATPGANGEIPTATEADARTIMTAMALNNIAKGTPVVAEIIDAVMDQYLRLAQVHDIIYTRETGRMMLAMASTGTGVTNVFQELLNPHNASIISTYRIEEKSVDKAYGEFQMEFSRQFPRRTLIGILENSGNVHQAKEFAIRRAQQTPNVAEFVANLQTVKDIKFNQPVFNPPPEYVLRQGSMAIVIENREI